MINWEKDNQMMDNFKATVRSIDEGIYSLLRTEKRKSSKQALQLRADGYILLDHLVGSDLIEEICEVLQRKLSNLEFRKPLLSQSKVNRVEHEDIIKNNFLLERDDLTALGLSATINPTDNLSNFVLRERPSTLELDMPDDHRFYSVWLDEVVLDIVSEYFGFTPVMCEAFIRRNYPSDFHVMNHGWHRDRNHRSFLLKAFIFLNDCDYKNGPHHFLAKSHLTSELKEKKYYSDSEVDEYSHNAGLEEIVSIVPKGTIILEDTRGLHKAGIPMQHFRDLGFATFMPNRLIKKRTPDYNISHETEANLNSQQKKFIIRR